MIDIKKLKQKNYGLIRADCIQQEMNELTGCCV